MDFLGIILGAGIAIVTGHLSAARSEGAAHRLRRRERKEESLTELAGLLFETMLATSKLIDEARIRPDKAVSAFSLVDIQKPKDRIVGWASRNALHLPEYWDMSTFIDTIAPLQDLAEREQGRQERARIGNVLGEEPIRNATLEELVSLHKVIEAELVLLRERVIMPVGDLVPLLTEPSTYDPNNE